MSAHDEALAAQDRLSKLGNKAIVMAAVEKNESDSQIVKLEKIANEVEELMAAGELDRAEIVASGLRWQPDPTRSKISESEAELIKQYDERRATMQRVIESALSRKTL